MSSLNFSDHNLSPFVLAFFVGFNCKEVIETEVNFLMEHFIKWGLGDLWIYSSQSVGVTTPPDADPETAS